MLSSLKRSRSNLQDLFVHELPPKKDKASNEWWTEQLKTTPFMQSTALALQVLPTVATPPAPTAPTPTTPSMFSSTFVCDPPLSSFTSSEQPQPLELDDSPVWDDDNVQLSVAFGAFGPPVVSVVQDNDDLMVLANVANNDHADQAVQPAQPVQLLAEETSSEDENIVRKKLRQTAATASAASSVSTNFVSKKTLTQEFIDLAQPDQHGVSRWVLRSELIVRLTLGNGGAWFRKESSLAAIYRIELDRSQTKGVRVDRIRLNGFVGEK